MPEFGHPDGPALDEFARTDLLLDALAERERVDIDDPKEDALAALLGDWRDDLRWPPASALISPEEAVAALHAGLAERRPRQSRGLATVGSVAAACWCSAALAPWWSRRARARRCTACTRCSSTSSRQSGTVMLSAKADLAKVQEMIDKGQWAQAQSQLNRGQQLGAVHGRQRRRKDLMNEVNLLNTKVETRNPNATLPAPAADADRRRGRLAACGAACSRRRAPERGYAMPAGQTHRYRLRRRKHHHHGQQPPPVAPAAVTLVKRSVTPVKPVGV